MIEHILSVTKGDTATYNLTFADSDGLPINITGWTIFFTVKAQPDDAVDDALALISKTVTVHTTPASGLTQIALTPVNTSIARGRHYFDIQAKTNTGTILTIMKGRFEVTYDITRRTT